LLTPHYFPSTRGNSITVRRIEQQLQLLGCTTAVFSLESASAESIAEELRRFSPDIVHAFHAVRCGELARCWAAENHIPYIITMTGTDVYASAGTAACGSIDAIRAANALVFFAEQVREGFFRTYPQLAVPMVVIPQGVILPVTPCAESSVPAEFNFLLPAGIRAVKNLLFPFHPLAELQRRYPQVRLILAGGVIEPLYAAKLFAVISANPFAGWAGEVDFEAMPELYCSAHVVLNSSLSEGGMANSLLEGMAFGKALLAADVEGNRSLVNDSGAGLLYSGADDFSRKAEVLLFDKELRQDMGAAGRAYVRRHCSPVVEAERYLQLYTSCF
jgi:hypothetical protein